MEDTRIGCYLDEHYKRIVMSAERKLFPCCKNLPGNILRNEYPKCKERTNTNLPFSFNEWRDIYYGILIEDIKKRHPSKIMEAFMCGWISDMATVGIEKAIGTRGCAGCGKRIRPNQPCLHLEASGVHYPVKVNLCWMCVMKFNEELLFQQCSMDEVKK